MNSKDKTVHAVRQELLGAETALLTVKRVLEVAKWRAEDELFEPADISAMWSAYDFMQGKMVTLLAVMDVVAPKSKRAVVEEGGHMR